MNRRDFVKKSGMFGAVCLFPFLLIKTKEKKKIYQKPKIVKLEIITHTPEYKWLKLGELGPCPEDPTEEVFLTFGDESRIGYGVEERGWVEYGGIQNNKEVNTNWNVEKITYSSSTRLHSVAINGVFSISKGCIRIQYSNAHMWIKLGKRL